MEKGLPAAGSEPHWAGGCSPGERDARPEPCRITGEEREGPPPPPGEEREGPPAGARALARLLGVGAQQGRGRVLQKDRDPQDTQQKAASGGSGLWAVGGIVG